LLSSVAPTTVAAKSAATRQDDSTQTWSAGALAKLDQQRRLHETPEFDAVFKRYDSKSALTRDSDPPRFSKVFEPMRLQLDDHPSL
jgi:hypothetical protein